MTDQNIMDIRPVPVQQYKNATVEEAIAHGCDIIQPKYDGWNARIEIHYGWVTWYSKSDRKYHQILYPDSELHAVLYGEHMFGTQWSKQPTHEGATFIFDIHTLNGENVAGFTYRERYSLIRSLLNRLPANFRVVPTHPISEYARLWQELVVDGGFEGLVFRRKTDPLTALILRHKNTITEDLRIVGFIEGEGKHAGRLGAVQAVTKTGVPVDVGGGFDDLQRYEIWNARAKYLGRWFEVEAKGKFESGSLRHPNFIRWRDDLIGA